MGNLIRITRARRRSRLEFTRPESWMLIAPTGPAHPVEVPVSFARIGALLEIPEGEKLGSLTFGVGSTLWLNADAQQQAAVPVNRAAVKALEIHGIRGAVVRGTVLVHHKEATMPRQRGRW